MWKTCYIWIPLPVAKMKNLQPNRQTSCPRHGNGVVKGRTAQARVAQATVNLYAAEKRRTQRSSKNKGH